MLGRWERRAAPLAGWTEIGAVESVGDDGGGGGDWAEDRRTLGVERAPVDSDVAVSAVFGAGGGGDDDSVSSFPKWLFEDTSVFRGRGECTTAASPPTLSFTANSPTADGMAAAAVGEVPAETGGGEVASGVAAGEFDNGGDEDGDFLVGRSLVSFLERESSPGGAGTVVDTDRRGFLAFGVHSSAWWEKYRNPSAKPYGLVSGDCGQIGIPSLTSPFTIASSVAVIRAR